MSSHENSPNTNTSSYFALLLLLAVSAKLNGITKEHQKEEGAKQPHRYGIVCGNWLYKKKAH